MVYGKPSMGGDTPVSSAKFPTVWSTGSTHADGWGHVTTHGTALRLYDTND